jgi:glutamate-1-semialdehyde 2,1-aminomutase
MIRNPENFHTERSRKIFQAATEVIPGGVNSPVRAFRSVGGDPVAIARGKGSRVWDADGNEYIDYICSWGPLLFGHAPEFITQAIVETAPLGTSFGALTEREVLFAQEVRSMVPSMEMVRLVSSGTEAVMSALRLARAFTGRELVIKFEGGYHGHNDALLSKAGSGLATQGLPDSKGVPAAYAGLTLTIPFNDLQALQTLLKERGAEVACLIGEPIPGNMGVVPPQPGFWKEAKAMLQQAGALLVFDEVITGFRASAGGAQALIGVSPDISTFGKILGGGLPMGAYGGRRDIMGLVAPVGPMYQAGTLSGNPLAVAAGRAMLAEIRRSNPYPRLNEMGISLANGIRDRAGKAGIPVTINQQGSVLTVFFSDKPVTNYQSACFANTQRYASFFRQCLARGLLLPPSQFEAWFLSTAHTPDDIQTTLDIVESALRTL